MPTLYHFTHHVWWHFIEREGITRGECPVNETTVIQHPNLTTDPDPTSQIWTVTPDKAAVRITVEVPDGDDRLVSWRTLTERYGMGRKYYRELNEAGGWRAKAWWIYQGVIPVGWFSRVDVLAPATPGVAAVLDRVRRYDRFEDFRREHLVIGPLGIETFTIPM